ncbi:putative serine/threonine protein kinase [Leptomonas pyrrhocoris]|uniref:Putative serine/threonine protein kinase n=1 Tax=Leptomonas pyrrhocoris TaxID=157538 RepID=A0A0M9G234_LEPPY|nr:putative serine/threonine protein kinase [Leptomonas pyrrhocoris]KPA80596.1 putative serine/threonine protein kinase [Leptomonas pyrrhocoris]|eukprot:XP_015659035.1 putative serine/threonine protein kinase [Leptomonas pyrrhocoris]
MAQAQYQQTREGSYHRSRAGAAPAPMTSPEQTIGSYVIGETVGRGSFGKVKKGRHKQTNEPVAIKILNKQKLRTANMDRKIHREIEILQLFSHPSICRLYEVISTPTDMYLIMEYVEGGELYDYIVQKGRVRESEARYIFQQIVCAIEYCHHFRVVHRDLKPENILLGTGLQVKLIDFGLSNIMKDGEFLATSCGSPNYAAPEVISGKLYFGPEVDVWSCGVILYALLCGCLPFDEDSIPVLFSKIKKGKYTFPPNMPPGPRELIQQILTVDPLVRLTIPQIRDNAWFNQRLPMRLSYNESIFSVKEDRIISVLVSETAKRLGLRERDVRKELEHGAGNAYVAYNILMDARRRREIAAEVRELGMSGDDARGVNHVIGPQQTKFQPKAMERELNMGLMLTQSPAMEVLLDEADAATNKSAYNTGSFVPASVATFGDPARASKPGSDVGGFGGGTDTDGALAVGSFRITSKVRSSSLIGSGSVGSSSHVTGSLRGGGGGGGVGSGGGLMSAPGFSGNASSGSYRRGGLQGGSTAALQLGATLTDQPRVGSVARKHSMYTAEEEQFIVENNFGWRVGLMTDTRAEQALTAIYNVLRAFGMEWKVASPFRLLARSTAATWTTMAQLSSPTEPARCSAMTVAPAASSAPIRIGGAVLSRTASDDPEGDDIAGSTQRDEDSVHPHLARPRRPGAGGRSSPGGYHSSSPVARGNYFGDLPGVESATAAYETPIASSSSSSARLPPLESTVEACSAPIPLTSQQAGALSVSTSAPSSPPAPAKPVVLSVYLFRIHERHDKGYLVDLKVMRNTMIGMDLVLLISNALIKLVG